MMLYEEFVDYYNKNGKCPNQMKEPNRPLNERQLKSAYKRYIKGEEKKKMKKEEQIEKLRNKDISYDDDQELKEVYNIVDKRDKGECQLLNKYSYIEYNKLRVYIGAWSDIIDHAHVFGKGAYPALKYDPENIVLLNRYSHNMLDQGRDPIKGDLISKKFKKLWWEVIIGTDRYKNLLKKIKKNKEK